MSSKSEKGEKIKTDKKKNEGQKQSTLDSRVKKVSFEVDEKSGKVDATGKFEEFKTRIVEEVRKIRQEKVEIEKLKCELLGTVKELDERIEKIEKILQSWEEREREKEDADSLSAVSTRSRLTDGARGSNWSIASAVSGVSGASGVSLTEREVWKMKRIVTEQDRRERQNNIVIKGMSVSTDDLKKQVEDFIQKRLDMRIEIEGARKSGNVIVVKVSAENKSEIMKRKSRLAGTKIFIENDLSYDERKRQEDMYKWVKEKKELGWNVKAGTGRVLFKGVWRKWEEKEKIEQEMEKNSNSNEEKEKRLERKEQNNREATGQDFQ